MTNQFETIKSPWDNNFEFKDGKIICCEGSEILLMFRKKKELKNFLQQIDQLKVDLKLDISLLKNYLDKIYDIDELEALSRFADFVFGEIKYIKNVMSKSDIDYQKIAEGLIISLNNKIQRLTSKK